MKIAALLSAQPQFQCTALSRIRMGGTCVSCIGRHIFHLELNISILDLFSTREEISLEFYTYNMCIEKARELKKKHLFLLY